MPGAASSLLRCRTLQFHQAQSAARAASVPRCVRRGATFQQRSWLLEPPESGHQSILRHIDAHLARTEMPGRGGPGLHSDYGPGLAKVAACVGWSGAMPKLLGIAA